MDGPRLDSGRVGVAVWWDGTGWGGRPHYLGANNEAYDAEDYAIYKALKIFEQRGVPPPVHAHYLLGLRIGSGRRSHRPNGFGPTPGHSHPRGWQTNH